MAVCRCGCGEPVKRGRIFVNKEHHLAWMVAGGAREMNALQPLEAKQRGGKIAGQQAVDSDRLRDAGLKGAAVSREIAKRFHAARASSHDAGQTHA